jgi:hypothetical protein
MKMPLIRKARAGTVTLNVLKTNVGQGKLRKHCRNTAGTGIKHLHSITPFLDSF